MALPKFYLETRKTKDGKQPINMFYSIYGQRLQYYTGVRIDPIYFKDHKIVKDKDTGEKVRQDIDVDRTDIKKLISDLIPNARQIKDSLSMLAVDAQNIANQAKANKIPVTKELLRFELDKIHKHKEKPVEDKDKFNFISFFENIIADSKSGIRIMQKGKSAGQKYSHNAIKNYGTTLSALKRFMLAKRVRVLKFDDIDKSFYDQFKKFCFGEEQKEVSTFSGYIKDIKSIMNEAKELGLQTADGHKAASFILPTYEADTIYLNDDQIDLISKLDLSNSEKWITHFAPARKGRKSELFDKKGNRILVEEKVFYPTLEKVRDLALIGFYTGLRFGNFTNLKAKDIQESFLKVKQVKTGSMVTIPIMQKLKPVLEKYLGDLPTITNQRFNTYIKLVAREAGLTQMVSIKNFKGNIETTTEQPLYSLISSHTCRRSYATNMFRKGVPSMLIMSATGHATESSFLKYIRATNEDKAMLMAEVLAKLGL